MGKGYNNFMSKKPFHPGSRDNIKRVWIAEQKAEDDKKRQEELRIQYEKEQDLYQNRLLVSKDSKEKLSLNFMYEAPPGAKRERTKEDDEPEYKFEWQRNAPRESFAKNNLEIRDQPFGIQVRNVRCLKCHNWGHLNTDRECPLYNKASTIGPTPPTLPASSSDPESLVKAMREDGLSLKKSLIGQLFDSTQANQLLVPTEEDPEMAFLKSLSKKEKKKLLKKINKLSISSTHTHKKHKKEKRERKEKKVKREKKDKEKKHRSSKEKDRAKDRKYMKN